MKINAAIITTLVLLAIALFVAPFLIYGYYFYDLGISKVNANWGSFGSFLSGVFSFFTALFTLASVVILVSTFRKTIHFSQQQIKIAQHESELNNFNFIINLIHKNIKENKTLTGFVNGIETQYFDRLSLSFIKLLMWCNMGVSSGGVSAGDMELSNQIIADNNLKSNINKYAKEYAYNHADGYACLNNIYPLVQQLCLKIIDSEKNQTSILKSILSSGIDEHILFWSLAIINDDRFDFLMVPPRDIRSKFEQD